MRMRTCALEELRKWPHVCQSTSKFDQPAVICVSLPPRPPPPTPLFPLSFSYRACVLNAQRCPSYWDDPTTSRLWEASKSREPLRDPRT